MVCRPSSRIGLQARSTRHRHRRRVPSTTRCRGVHHQALRQGHREWPTQKGGGGTTSSHLEHVPPRAGGQRRGEDVLGRARLRRDRQSELCLVAPLTRGTDDGRELLQEDRAPCGMAARASGRSDCIMLTRCRIASLFLATLSCQPVFHWREVVTQRNAGRIAPQRQNSRTRLDALSFLQFRSRCESLRRRRLRWLTR